MQIQVMNANWTQFKNNFYHNAEHSISLDISKMNFESNFLESMEAPMQKAFTAMDALEKGSIANPDENRMVGHYWLRNSDLAPNKQIKEEINSTLDRIIEFTHNVHSGKISGEHTNFKNILVIGIGGSALGPQFVSQALGSPNKDKMNVYFIDNTDPDGIDTIMERLKSELPETLSIVISKSGGTPETRNGMLEAKHFYEKHGLVFAKHAIAITGLDSTLDKYAKENKWIDTFPMWDWVGGRTSELATVGLIPAALQGINIQDFLAGAAAMDTLTRSKETKNNPAALLALMWYHATNGKGEKDMVILPYKDRLQLFSKYLQQLIMESLGKEKDLEGNTVYQGIAVYGNKGSTDQHAYVQQLREGVPNFFATFIEVLKERNNELFHIDENENTCGDYLEGFLLGTRSALYDNGRESMTITIDEVTPHSVGMLIALYERAVGFYASLVNINAYHQPGVEAGKKAAAAVLNLKGQIVDFLKNNKNEKFTVEQISESIQATDKSDWVFKLLEQMAANPTKGLRKETAANIFESKYGF